MEGKKKRLRREAKFAVFSRFYQTAIRLSAKGITPGKKYIAMFFFRLDKSIDDHASTVISRLTNTELACSTYRA